jgi:hypothetical protein
MKLSQKALKAINNPVTRRRLMDVLGCTEFTIARYIQKNEKIKKHKKGPIRLNHSIIRSLSVCFYNFFHYQLQ